MPSLSSGTSQRLLPAVRTLANRRHFSRVMPFQTGRFRRLQCTSVWSTLAKFPGSAASSLCPFLGGSRQPLDRQVRYYSGWTQLASDVSGTSAPSLEEYFAAEPAGFAAITLSLWHCRPACAPSPQKRQSATPLGWRFGLRKSLASRIFLLQLAGWSSLRWRRLVPGVCVFCWLLWEFAFLQPVTSLALLYKHLPCQSRPHSFSTT